MLAQTHTHTPFGLLLKHTQKYQRETGFHSVALSMAYVRVCVSAFVPRTFKTFCGYLRSSTFAKAFFAFLLRNTVSRSRSMHSAVVRSQVEEIRNEVNREPEKTADKSHAGQNIREFWWMLPFSRYLLSTLIAIGSFSENISSTVELSTKTSSTPCICVLRASRKNRMCNNNKERTQK